MIIYLIGMPGCGKSTLGKILSEKLNYDFVDMDQYIEKEACMFIDEIFDAYGENFFRALETNTLNELSKRNNTVISTGGGIIKNKLHKEIMSNGKCIYLEVPIEELEKRVEKTEDVRPLLQTKTIKELYLERKNLYEYFSDIKVLNIDMDKAISQILEEIKK